MQKLNLASYNSINNVVYNNGLLPSSIKFETMKGNKDKFVWVKLYNSKLTRFILTVAPNNFVNYSHGGHENSGNNENFLRCNNQK